MKNIISTDKAPAAIGPYSQAVEVNGLVFTSGVVPIDPATGELVTGPAEVQAERAFKSLKALLEAAGSSTANVIKTTVFISDMNDFGKINEVYAKYFTSKPARSCVAVKTLPKNVLCEVEVIAVVE
mgnify:CR=1 FL=1